MIKKIINFFKRIFFKKKVKGKVAWKAIVGFAILNDNCVCRIDKDNRGE